MVATDTNAPWYKIIYGTNAIESPNMSLKKIIENRGHFPSDHAAL